MKPILTGIILLILLSINLQAQESGFPQCAVGMIVDKDENILGSGVVALSSKNVLTCLHVIRPTTGPIYYHAYMSDVAILLTVEASNYDSDIVILKSNEELCRQPLKLNIDYPNCITDTIGYVGVSLKESDDSVAAIEFNKSIVETVGQYRGIYGRRDFIEFPGRGEPGFSGSPVFNSKGEVIAILSKGFYMRGVKAKNEELFNRATLFPKKL